MSFPATTNAAGTCVGGPDVCKTPILGVPVPIPYVNVTQCATINGGTASAKVRILNMKTAKVGTETTVSTGDAPGTLGGVVSGTNLAGGKFTMGCPKVLVEGSPMVRLTSMIGMNNPGSSNLPPGLQVAPSQVKVLVSP